MLNNCSKEKKHKLLKVCVALFLLYYVYDKLKEEDEWVAWRQFQEESVFGKDIYDATDIRDRIQVISVIGEFGTKNDPDDGKKIDSYHWRSLLKTHEFEVITDSNGEFISADIYTHWRLKPLFYIFGPLLFFVWYILTPVKRGRQENNTDSIEHEKPVSPQFKTRKRINVFVAIGLVCYIFGILIIEDIKTSNRLKEESAPLATKESFDATAVHNRHTAIHNWLKVIKENSIKQHNGYIIDTYHWDSLLRTREFNLVTDPDGRYVWSKISIIWKPIPFFFNITAILFFVCYILFRK